LLSDQARRTRLGLWYFALLLPTLFFKRAALDAFYEEGIAPTLDSQGLHGVQRVAWWLWAVRSDVWQVLVAVIVVYVLGHLVLRRSLQALAAGSVLSAMLVSAGNWISFVVLGTLLNGDNLRIAVDWLRAHPEEITQQGSGPLIALAVCSLLALAALWTVATYFIVRDVTESRRTYAVARLAPALLVVLLMVTSAAPAAAGGVRLSDAARRGYWSATFGSLAGGESWQPLAERLPSDATLKSQYLRLAYGLSDESEASGTHDASFTSESPSDTAWIKSLTRGARVPRHILIISLETAPSRFYPIVDDSSYPAFYRMGQRGIATTRHYSTVPATTWAIFSIVSGTYPRFGRPLLEYGDFRTDGLASVLGAHEYETTYIDSYRIDWQLGERRGRNSRLLADLGFATQIESPSDSLTRRHGAYETGFAHDRRSLALAADQVTLARSHGRHALVVVATILGHYPWKAPAGEEQRTGPEKIQRIAHALDSLVGGLLDSLSARHLADSIIVVVTGDHGLRARTESESLGEPLAFGNLSFNVPFLLYAPGLIPTPVRLPYSTSHVDIAPTLLELVGIRTDSLLLHGENMLHPRLAERTIFLMNGSLRPVDGFRQHDSIVALNRLTDQVEVAPDGAAPRRAGNAEARRAMSLLDRARELFDRTSAAFLQRVAGHDERGVATGAPRE